MVQAKDLESLPLEVEQALSTLEAPVEEAPVEEKQMPGDSVTWDSERATVEEDRWGVNWD